MTPIHSLAAFWRWAKRHLLPIAADQVPVPLPNIIKEQLMSFSISILGHVASEIEGEAARIEDAILTDVRRLVASYDAITGGSFVGSAGTTDLGPVAPAVPPVAVPAPVVEAPPVAPVAPVVAPVADVPVAPPVVDPAAVVPPAVVEVPVVAEVIPSVPAPVVDPPAPPVA